MHCFIRLIHQYTGWVFSYFEIGEMTISIIYFILVIADFRLAEWIYDKCLVLMLQQNEKIIHRFFKWVRKIMENTVYGWLQAFREIVIALIASCVPLLPGFIQNTLEFMGFVDWLNKNADKYKRFEETKKKEREYMEYAKNLEKNRPTSPNKDKTDKIEFPATSTGKDFKLVPKINVENVSDKKSTVNP